MSTVLLIIQLIISIILTGLILIQRSEGGALGIGGGGGGGGGGLMSGRSATTSVARMTGILGAIFIINCLALSVVFQIENRDNLIIDEANAVAPLTAPADSSDATLPLAEETQASDELTAPSETETESTDATGQPEE